MRFISYVLDFADEHQLIARGPTTVQTVYDITGQFQIAH